jgi:hypothetical protein
VERTDTGVPGDTHHQQTDVGGETEDDDSPGPPGERMATTGVVNEDRRRRRLHTWNIAHPVELVTTADEFSAYRDGLRVVWPVMSLVLDRR